MERIESVKGTRNGLLGSETFRRVQKSMTGLSERQRALYSAAIVLEGVGSLLKGEVKGAVKVVVGAERFVDAALNGVVKRAEAGVKSIVEPFRDDLHTVRQVRASESSDNQPENNS